MRAQALGDAALGSRRQGCGQDAISQPRLVLGAQKACLWPRRTPSPRKHLRRGLKGALAAQRAGLQVSGAGASAAAGEANTDAAGSSGSSPRGGRGGAGPLSRPVACRPWGSPRGSPILAPPGQGPALCARRQIATLPPRLRPRLQQGAGTWGKRPSCGERGRTGAGAEPRAAGGGRRGAGRRPGSPRPAARGASRQRPVLTAGRAGRAGRPRRRRARPGAPLRPAKPAPAASRAPSRGPSCCRAAAGPGFRGTGSGQAVGEAVVGTLGAGRRAEVRALGRSPGLGAGRAEPRGCALEQTGTLGAPSPCSPAWAGSPHALGPKPPGTGLA